MLLTRTPLLLTKLHFFKFHIENVLNTFLILSYSIPPNELEIERVEFFYTYEFNSKPII